MQKSIASSLKMSMLIVAALAFGTPALAAAINWDHSFLLQGAGGVANPLVRFGFDPQPDPPGRVMTQLDLGNRFMPRLSMPSPGGLAADSFFDVFFALALPGIQLVAFPPSPCDVSLPPNPCVVSATDFSDVMFDVFDDAASPNLMFTVLLGFETSGGGMGAGGAVYLNPQPEVPSLFGFSQESDGGLTFQFTSFSNLRVTLQVFDAQNTQLSFSAVPEPGTVGLLGFGLAGCAALRRRYGRR